MSTDDENKSEAAGLREKDRAEAAGLREKDLAEAAGLREDDRAEAAWFRREDRAVAAIAGAEAAIAGAEAGAGAGAATGAAAGTAHAEAAREAYITTGARQAARKLAFSLCVLFVIVIGIGAANLLFTNRQASINDCQRVVNTRFQQADIERANATRASGEAQIELWNALIRLHGNPAQQRAEFIRAFNDYKAKLHKVTAVKFPDKTGTQACAG